MADLVVLNGPVWTGRSDRPWAEGVAVAAGRILRVGDGASVRALAGPETEVLDARGGIVLPGFIDSHTHFLDGGFSLRSLQLRDAAGPREFADRIAARAAAVPEGEWILNGEWDHQLFDPPELPRRDWVDAATPRHPVFVNRLDGHMALANGLALRLAGITRDTVAPPGGEIVKDPETGEPTGILKDTAMDLVSAVIPEPSAAETRAAALAALRHAAENGLTSVHEMADADSLEIWQALLREGGLTTRISVYIPITEVDTVARLKLVSPFGGDYLKLAGLKGFVDGSLGSETAYFFEPYTDNPSARGLLHGQMFPEGIMEERILAADAAGLQAAVHAIGDCANALLLDIYATAEARHGRRDRRFRIEHAQHLRPEDIGRFGRLGVIASVQPYHAADDGRWAETKIGPERARTTYAFRSLAAAGAVLACGSDWPVAPLSPIEGIWAAVTRSTIDGGRPDGWIPDERLTVDEAVRGYTAGGAYAEFAESFKGTIEAGKAADLVVLDRNLFEVPPAEIRGLRATATVCGGRVVFRRS